MRCLGTDDSVNTCDCCGKTGLRLTVIVELDSGEIQHYGTTCATRNTGKPAAVLAAEADENVEAARREYHKSPEYLAECARFAQRDPRLLGRAAADFVRDAREAARIVREAIARRFHVEASKIY